MQVRRVAAHVLLLALLLWVPGAQRPVWAAASSKAVNVGNAVCPVSGDKVDGRHFMTYQGKRYGLCCGMCAKDFKKDPEKYIATLAAVEPGMSSQEHPGEAAHEHPGQPA